MPNNDDTARDGPAADEVAPDGEDDGRDDDAKQILDLPVDDSTAEDVAGGARRSDYDYGDRSLG